jgi:spermidine/putrescine transport system ATP-binding protein
MGEFLEFDNVSKAFGSVRAVDAVSLSIKRGEFFSLLGPSGCGKTTLLRMLGGFERPDTGRILLDGVDITELPPNRRQVNTIFQSYALFPHLSVWENIAFGLRIAKLPRQLIRERVARMLTLIKMEDHAHKKPHQISGGQKQRVAVARALINQPSVLLLDEPLAALDLKLRQHMLIELDLIHDEVGITFLYVTHDQGEAMSLSDRIAVMNCGRVEQLGTPGEIYETPCSSFVAAFIGDTNFFEGRVISVHDTDYCTLDIEGLPRNAVVFNDKDRHPGDLVFLSVRPEKFRISRERPEVNAKHTAMPAVVEDIIYLGSHTKYWVRAGDQRLAINQQHGRFLLDENAISWNDPVWIWWHADDGYMLERYSASDERLIQTPPDTVGQNAVTDDPPAAPV